ncbi:hypothetical protein D3C72_2023980 [compost metagenome]
MTPLAAQVSMSDCLMRDEELAMSMVFSPTPSQSFLRPAPEPPDSTTGVGKSVFSPKASATMEA